MAIEDKPLISISIIGHVDSGKSTLSGRLLTVFGDLDKRTEAKLEQAAKEYNKESFKFAYAFDTSKAERERGITIQTTLRMMQTSKFKINILDCPGHADFIKNATNGCKQSDLSIVVVPANFQASVSEEGTLKTHLQLATVLGANNFIVCINKLDACDPKKGENPQTAYDAALAAVTKLFRKVGAKRDTAIFLPISAYEGVGLFRGREQFPWFKGFKPSIAKPGFDMIMCLEDAIDYQEIPVRAVDRPLRLPISGISHIPGHGVIFCGRVDYGSIKRKDMVKLLPSGLVSEVKNVQAHRQDVEAGVSGMNIGFNVMSKDKQQLEKIKNGFIVGPESDKEFKIFPFYLAGCTSLKPKGKSGSQERGIRNGYTPVLSCGTANIACKVAKIVSSVGKDGVKVENPEFVPKDSRFEALIYPTKPILCETIEDYPALGKFVFRDSGILVAVGRILKRVSEEDAAKLYGVNVQELMNGPKAVAEIKGKKK